MPPHPAPPRGSVQPAVPVQPNPVPRGLTGGARTPRPRNNSGVPPTALVTIGRPAALSSMTALLMPSCRDSRVPGSSCPIIRLTFASPPDFPPFVARESPMTR